MGEHPHLDRINTCSLRVARACWLPRRRLFVRRSTWCRDHGIVVPETVRRKVRMT